MSNIHTTILEGRIEVHYLSTILEGRIEVHYLSTILEGRTDVQYSYHNSRREN